jgi:hypothetical protein
MARNLLSSSSRHTVLPLDVGANLPAEPLSRARKVLKVLTSKTAPGVTSGTAASIKKSQHGTLSSGMLKIVLRWKKRLELVG